MRIRALQVLGGITLVTLLIPGFLLAGEVELGGKDDAVDPPDPDDDSTIELDWNPSVTCDDHTTLQELLSCMLAQGHEQAATFVATELGFPRHGVELRRTTLLPSPPFPEDVEIARLELFEDDSAIANTYIRVNRSDLIVRIREVEEAPHETAPGFIRLELDDYYGIPDGSDPLQWRESFAFEAGQDLFQFNAEMVMWLRYTLGFDVTWSSPFIYISRPGGFKRVRYYSSDKNVAISDISLLPFNDPEIDPLLF